MNHNDVISLKAIFWVTWALGGMVFFLVTEKFFIKISNGWKAILWVLICGPFGWLGLVLAGLMILWDICINGIKNWFTS